MSDKKKVLGKGKFKVKEPPLVKKLELPKASNDSLTSDDYSFKKTKSPKILNAQSTSDISKKCATPTPLSTAKRRFFNKRISETPKMAKDDFENKRKSMPNIQETNEGYDTYIKTLGTKLSKYKQKYSELEEKLKHMEARFHLEENSLRGEVEKLNNDMKKQKIEHAEQEVELHKEILRLRRQNEESEVLFKFQISQLGDLLEACNDASFKEKAEALLNECFKSGGESQADSEDPVIVPSNCTASFSNLPNEIQSSREILRAAQAQAIVLNDYSPRSQGELRLKSGDRVIILNSDESNGWWLGRIGDKIGMFPRNCVMLD